MKSMQGRLNHLIIVYLLLIVEINVHKTIGIEHIWIVLKWYEDVYDLSLDIVVS